MAASSPPSINQLLPKSAHSALVFGQTGCGKTAFVLVLLEGPYRGLFRHIVVLCPIMEHNKTYKQWTDPEVYVLDPGERLHDYLWAFYLVFKGEPTLLIIDDCSHEGSDTEKRHALRARFLGPPRRPERLVPHPEVQRSPHGPP